MSLLFKEFISFLRSETSCWSSDSLKIRVFNFFRIRVIFELFFRTFFEAVKIMKNLKIIDINQIMNKSTP